MPDRPELRRGELVRAASYFGEQAALAARRKSVLLYRPAFAQTSELWRNRFDRSSIWASTPTLERASFTASDLANQFTPPDDAAEALAASQDAAEGFASLGMPMVPAGRAAYRRLAHRHRHSRDR